MKGLTRMETTRWLSMPQQVEVQVAAWEAAHPEWVSVERITQYTGQACLAVTVGTAAHRNWRESDAGKGAAEAASEAAGAGETAFGEKGQAPAAWFCVPHAHEPAGTAAIMDTIEQLLTGRGLDGRPASFDDAAARERLVLTFNPDANPGGRAWSPVVWWDGTRYSNEEFWAWMRGVDPATGGMWQRVNRWSLRQTQPLRRGIVYEQLNEHEFVEPNRDPGSSLVRLFQRLNARYRYVAAMHLHQTEFERSPHNCMINLPVLQPELPPAVQAGNQAWGEAVIARWQAMGAAPIPAPRSFPYYQDTQTVQWFRECWGESQHQAPELVVEVQNNNPRTPPEQQLALESAAIQVTIERLLAGAFRRNA